MFYFLPIWIVLLSNFFFYFRCLSFLKGQILSQKNLRHVHNLLYYPIFLIICWILMTIFRMIDCFLTLDNQIFVMFAVFLSTMSGFFDSLLFFTHPQILKSCKALKRKSIDQSVEERISMGKLEDSAPITDDGLQSIMLNPDA